MCLVKKGVVIMNRLIIFGTMSEVHKKVCELKEYTKKNGIKNLRDLLLKEIKIAK